MDHTRPTTNDGRRRLRLWQSIGVVLSPFVLTIVVITVVYAGTGGTSPLPQLPIVVYSLLSVLVVGLHLRWLSKGARTTVVPMRPPTRSEVAIAIAVALTTIIVVDPVATLVSNVLGSGASGVGSFDSALGGFIVIVASVLLAPVLEEYLYRGVAFDALLTRYGVVVAVIGSSALFGGIHLLIGGVSGSVSAALSGLLYAGMRNEFENLTGAIVAHAVNNLYWVLVMGGIIPNVVP